MTPLAYVTEKRMTNRAFAAALGVHETTISRLMRNLLTPDPDLAVKMVVASRGAIKLDDLYGTPVKYRADRARG